jgi:hypothetical protein
MAPTTFPPATPADNQRETSIEAQLAICRLHAERQGWHPGMADLYRKKVSELCSALDQEDARAQASEALRGLLGEIVLEPDGQQLRILVKGNLAAMLKFAQNEKRHRSPEMDDLERTISLVAGARNHRYCAGYPVCA